jgi:hypothetical protein
LLAVDWKRPAHKAPACDGPAREDPALEGAAREALGEGELRAEAFCEGELPSNKLRWLSDGLAGGGPDIAEPKPPAAPESDDILSPRCAASPKGTGRNRICSTCGKWHFFEPLASRNRVLGQTGEIGGYM